MKDIQRLRELILGFAIITPISCQSVPAQVDEERVTPPEERRVEDKDPAPSPTLSETERAAFLDANIRTARANIQSASYRAESSSRRALAGATQGTCSTLPELYAIQKQAYDAQYDAWKRKMTNFGGGRISKPTSLPSRLKTCPAYKPRSFNAAGCGSSPAAQLTKSTVTKGGTLCCYIQPPAERQMPCGRAYLVADGATTAGWSETTDWMGRAVDAPHALDEERALLAGEAWLADALEEHASIAAFSRATLELMRLGAPADLLAEYQSASLDEIRHAKMCFSLASALLGRELSAGRLEVEGPRDDLDEIIADVFWGGCVGESVAALGAERALGACTWAPARRALQEIAEDEARHAALAWSTLSFLGQRAPERVRRLLEEVRAPEVATRPHTHAASADLGRLSHAQQKRAARDAWTHLIAPMVAELLG